MVRCRYQQCPFSASFNDEGSKTAAYCKQHAEDGMVNVRTKRCSHISCTTRPSFNIEEINIAVYCKQHAEEGMVDVSKRRCSHHSCMKYPRFNVGGSKTAEYCQKHAEKGMVNIWQKRCSHDSCTRQPGFNFEGIKRALYCKKHAEDGMVNVKNKRCSYDACTRHPSFNFEGIKTVMYCKQHAEDAMVNLRARHNSLDSSTTGPARGVTRNVESTAHTRVKSDTSNKVGMNSHLLREVCNRRKRSRRGFDVKQPSHCLDHGIWKGGVGQTVEKDPSNKDLHATSSVALRGKLSDSTIGTSAEQTRPGVPKAVPPPVAQRQSEEPIKTKIEIAVMF